jgi:dihydroorotate dehydrogenase
VSSPNTPSLRELQAIEQLRPLISGVQQALKRAARGRVVPLLLKVAPDLHDADIDAIADLAIELGLDGISATNTTIQRPVTLTTAPEKIDAAGEGGLSGPVLRQRSLEVLTPLHDRVGDRLALIGVGGVTTAEDVRERLAAGADLVQAYTGFIYGGPTWPAAMARAAR